MSVESYDAIVIGSGQGGTPLAVALAESGRKTAIIEKNAVGGSCVNYGCTPTKTLYASARVAALARRAKQFGVETGVVHVDLAEVRKRKQSIVDRFRSGDEEHLKATKNLDLIFGEARFTASKTIEVNGRTLAAREWVFINTGARSVAPRIDGLDRIRALDSTAMLDLDVLPAELVVVGGGYIGLELGQMFGRFGSRVTIVQRRPRLLDHEDDDVSDAVAELLQKEGIEVVLDADPYRVEARGNGRFELFVRFPDGSERALAGDCLLHATGRAPNTDRLNLAAAGVKTDARGYVEVNDRLETSAEGVYALGDVKGGPAFTHISYDDYRIVRANLLRGESATTRGRLVPYTVYIDPQLGRVGLSEKQARAEGRAYAIAKMKMNAVARAAESGETRGFMKVLVDPNTKAILGCAILGMEGGELMSMIELAMMGGLTYPKLRDAIFAHPALSESLNNLFGNLP